MFIFFLTANTASAFSVSPLKHILTLDPGDNQTVLITIKNSDSVGHQYKLAVESVTQDNQGRSVLVRGRDKAESWVSGAEKEIVIDAFASKMAEFKIFVPANASPGAHFLGLLAEETSRATEDIGVGARLAVVLQLQVAGLVTEKAEIIKWQTDNWHFDKNLNLSLAVKNNSNIEVPAQGKFILRNFFGEEIYQDVVNIGGKILPQTTRATVLDFFAIDLKMPGIYNIEVDLSYGLTGQTLRANARFWYLPVWSWWAAAGIILAAIFLLIKIKNRLCLKSAGE